ncbi:alanine--tRNA ligase [Candidatus Woesearchaeota archaeon]|nr:alanine--tRNA ligase [Candidatus Woesearchaeota archaeon]
MNAKTLKETYQNFFEQKGHKRIESASLIPENDASVLFTTAGMHPLVPFLLGQEHPAGKKLTDVQKCIRTGDIDEVGDDTHFTFFEMLGNWSLGEYFKEESIQMSFEFLTETLGFSKDKLAISCFAGDDDAPQDTASADAWKSLGIPENRIAFLPKKNNWWGPAGETGPCGPDTEIFYWNSKDVIPDKQFADDDERWVEIWNNVFMEYNKNANGAFTPLEQKNVDTGLGVERVAMILEGKPNVYEIATIKPVVDQVKRLTNIDTPNNEQLFSLRVITDHMRAATFILGDPKGITPSNVDQGYILRRFIRRSIRHFYLLKLESDMTKAILAVAEEVIVQFGDQYPELRENEEFIRTQLQRETEKFEKTIKKGLAGIDKMMTGIMLKETGIQIKSNHEKNLAMLKWQSEQGEVTLDVKWLFDMFQSQGMPPEMVTEEVKEAYNKNILHEEKLLADFTEEFKKHQELSRIGAEKKFKGGLADDSETTTRLHTATHLLNQALREVLGEAVKQKGSNITSERLRFDFNFDRKLSDEEKEKITILVNKKIQEKLPVVQEKMKLDDALKSGAQAEFGTRYPDEVWVYCIGDFSKEICTGPHVKNTEELGTFRIKKEESSAAGVRRIKAVLE